MQKHTPCPHCGGLIAAYCNPTPTVDVVIYDPARGVVLIERANPPYGHALPGGFIDEGETAEAAAVREMREETSLDVTLDGLLGVYSHPKRDPRMHTMSVVFVGHAATPDALCAGDDARKAAFYALDAVPDPLAFDHAHILKDFRAVLRGEWSLAPIQKNFETV